MENPKNQIEFERMFATEEQCLKYLYEIKFSNGFYCPKCKYEEHWHNKRVVLVCKKCRRETWVTSGTIFRKKKLLLVVLFRALWWIVAQKSGVSASGLQRVLGIGSYRTAWSWLHKFRRLMVFPSRNKLSGTIEVDGTFVGGKRAGKRGRGAEGKSIVIIAVEILGKGPGRVRMSIVPDASKKSLKKFIDDNIEKGSRLITDGWKGYATFQRKASNMR